MESSLTLFTPLGLTSGILLMSSTTLTVLPLRKFINFPQCSQDFIFSSADTVLELDVVLRFSGIVFVFVNLPEILVVISRAVPTSIVPEQVILSVPRREIFSLPLVSRFHCAVESAVPLSGCNVVDVYVRDLIYRGVYEFTAVVSPVPHDFGLSGFLVNFDRMIHGILKGFDPRVDLHYFV